MLDVGWEDKLQLLSNRQNTERDSLSAEMAQMGVIGELEMSKLPSPSCMSKLTSSCSVAMHWRMC